jgi:chromosome partitioning protein
MTATVLREPETAAGSESVGRRAHVIALGNEKGGTGKTTTAMHIAVSLLKQGKRVAAIDLDSRQKSFARYIENRAGFAVRTGHRLPAPTVAVVDRSMHGNADEAMADEAARLEAVLDAARADADFIIIDMPGNDTNLSRLGHASADTLVTPMNDSFLDFDLLAKFDPDNLEIKGPSLYSEFVWECRKKRLMARRPAIDWVVLRNRVSSTNARNKRRVGGALSALSARIGFRVAPGLSERVIFRELFPLGLTLFDLPLKGVPVAFTISHVSARQEIRELVATLRLPPAGPASSSNRDPALNA